MIGKEWASGEQVEDEGRWRVRSLGPNFRGLRLLLSLYINPDKTSRKSFLSWPGKQFATEPINHCLSSYLFKEETYVLISILNTWSKLLANAAQGIDSRIPFYRALARVPTGRMSRRYPPLTKRKSR